MATAARHAGQGDTDAGRQPACGPVSDGDISHLEPRGWGDYGIDEWRDGICAAEGQARGGIGSKAGTDRGRGRQAKVFAGIHESPGQGGLLPSVEERATAAGAG